MDFKDLIQRCKQNDRRAQKSMVDTYAPFLFAISVRYMKDHDAAQDIVQETFISVFAHLHQFKEAEPSFKGWIKRICINNALQKFRKKGYQNESYPEELPDTRASLPEVYSKLNADDLMELIGTLPDNYRQVFCLYVIEDYSHKEISEMLGMKESTSRSTLTRAKNMIKEKIWQLQKVVA